MLKFFYFFISIFSIILIVFRSHFVLGSILIFSRWILVFILLLGILFYKKRKSKKVFIPIIFTFILLLTDWAFDKYHTAQTFAFLESTKTQTLKVMTFNLYFRNKDPNVCINTILEYAPDLVFCQEITPDLKNVLDKNLIKKYPFYKVLALKGTHGVGVYSKYQLSNEYFLNNRNGLPFAHMVTINHPTKKIQTVNMHLASPAVAFAEPKNFVQLFKKNEQQRSQQWAKIEKELAKHDSTSPKIIIGDLNTLTYEPLYRNILSNTVDAYSAVGQWPGLTFPNTHKLPFKTARLDYILLQGNIAPIKAEVPQKSSSDHFAVYAELEI